jgi:hypothetical protein
LADSIINYIAQILGLNIFLSIGICTILYAPKIYRFALALNLKLKNRIPKNIENEEEIVTGIIRDNTGPGISIWILRIAGIIYSLASAAFLSLVLISLVFYLLSYIY